MRIACVQIDCHIGEPEYNRRYIAEHIRIAAQSGAELIVFPEAAITGYCFDSLDEAMPFAEPLDGPTANAVAEVCRETGTYAVAGFIEREGANYYNSAMLVGPSGLIGSYRKVHLPFLGVDRFLTPGNRPFQVFDLPFGKIGINICYDASFPESARCLKLLGADLILLPTNWPKGAWRTAEFIVNARANENHVNLAAVDRVGTERGWKFIGRSKVVDVNGDTIVEGSADNEEVLYADIDVKQAAQNKVVISKGQYELDRLGDRRPEFYRGISEAGSAASKTGSA
ncbi:MAG TPA: carbon-nitrogen hydrolase family protein [Blastocatellia bacterium]|nr:carbon-nitrogen hydrolase family protein [Blastocatellia bacterium]